jgi:hypothetical protein
MDEVFESWRHDIIGVHSASKSSGVSVQPV